mgnify:CR=1 FL=1
MMAELPAFVKRGWEATLTSYLRCTAEEREQEWQSSIRAHSALAVALCVTVVVHLLRACPPLSNHAHRHTLTHVDASHARMLCSSVLPDTTPARTRALAHSYYGALVHCTHCADVDLGVTATSLYGAVASDAALAAAAAATAAGRDVGTGAVHLGAAADVDAAYVRCTNITGAAGWACLAMSFNPAQGLSARVREVQASATATYWPAAATACADFAGGGLLVGGGAVLVRPGSAYMAAGTDTCSAAATAAAVSVTFTGATPGMVSGNSGGCGAFLSVLGCGSVPVSG